MNANDTNTTKYENEKMKYPGKAELVSISHGGTHRTRGRRLSAFIGGYKREVVRGMIDRK
jgi:hypothetical protein